MKHLFLFLMLLSLSLKSFAQNAEPSPMQWDLIQKSDTQYKAGWIFLGGGTALSLTAILIPRNFDYDSGKNNTRVISFLGWTGVLSISTSIPLFLSAGQNARMAARLSLENQAIHQPIILPGNRRSIPSLSLKIPL
ncbi:hypothetical protein [Algoriphagus boritolerans]|uniref:Uncharacterized protein n=1 Tax=Algoriphagus boritolerans DSM 17298 = JCM 18970 TaxID=1120964 RepID=A0A1H5YIS3_9BACT|nr:hypothetical protein [Algoriphagus boritolerans]SEG23602.1 hypothetical protein SAMN03080598_03017 [Algoriphagus boritolerans DSM 17298 = JCM 18970]